MSKVTVITGASSGIGAAVAKELGRRGHHLVLAARRERELKDIAQETGAQAVTVVTDVSRREDVNRLRDSALRAFDHVDVWINNAGRGISRPVLELTDEDFDEMMAVNVKSALYGIQAIMPHFLQRGEGHLINVSSFLGRVPFLSFRSAYNAAKHALNALTANLRMDMKAACPNIHVSLVMPGLVFTEFQKNALHGMPILPAGSRLPQGQSAEEVAAIIAELIDHPQAEAYTNPGQTELAIRYFQDIGAFEEVHQRT